MKFFCKVFFSLSPSPVILKLCTTQNPPEGSLKHRPFRVSESVGLGWAESYISSEFWDNANGHVWKNVLSQTLGTTGLAYGRYLVNWTPYWITYLRISWTGLSFLGWISKIHEEEGALSTLIHTEISHKQEPRRAFGGGQPLCHKPSCNKAWIKSKWFKECNAMSCLQRKNKNIYWSMFCI